jgi:hypothetical protein
VWVFRKADDGTVPKPEPVKRDPQDRRLRWLTVRDVEGLFQYALTTDGERQKQWYLEQIAEKLGLDLTGLDYEPGIPP